MSNCIRICYWRDLFYACGIDMMFRSYFLSIGFHLFAFNWWFVYMRNSRKLNLASNPIMHAALRFFFYLQNVLQIVMFSAISSYSIFSVKLTDRLIKNYRKSFTV
jgi:hypothetical protein